MIYTFVTIFVLVITLVAIFYYYTCNIQLLPQTKQADNVTWFNDYYTIEYIDKITIAIGEPRYHQKNYSYLIIGKDKAILFDTGPGIRNIRPVIDSLTKLPVMVISSHLHYDHVGNHENFEKIAMIDNKITKKRLKSEWFSPTYLEHLGFLEAINKPNFKVTEKLQSNQVIELGERALKVIVTPGHTKESIMLFDEKRNLLFTGDFIYEGDLIAFLPSSDVREYYQSTQELLAFTTNNTTLLAAHSGSSPSSLPILNQNNLINLSETLLLIINKKIDGKGFIFKTYKVNERINITIK